MAHPDLIFSFSLHGLSGYGALLLMLVVGGGTCLVWKRNPFKLADLVAPSVGSGIVLMRVGCFLHGCCFGKATDVPRGVRPAAGTEAAVYQLYQHIGKQSLFGGGGFEIMPIHPTQLYDALLAGSGAYLSYLLWKNGLPAGVGGLFFLVWYTIGRYVLAPFRAPSLSYDVHPSFFPRLYALVLIVAVGMVLGHMVYQKLNNHAKT